MIFISALQEVLSMGRLEARRAGSIKSTFTSQTQPGIPSAETRGWPQMFIPPAIQAKSSPLTGQARPTHSLKERSWQEWHLPVWLDPRRVWSDLLVYTEKIKNCPFFCRGFGEGSSRQKAAGDVNALYCGRAWAELETLQAGGSLVASPWIYWEFAFPIILTCLVWFFGEREKHTAESRESIWQGLIVSLSLSLLLSRDVRPLSELANFVFTNNSVGCRERKKKRR